LGVHLHPLLLNVASPTVTSFDAYCTNLCLCIGGTQGLFSNKTLEITDNVLASYKNQGW
jgi:hypothetical protein